MIEYFHLVSSIHMEQTRYVLCCRCSDLQYDQLMAIVCKGTKSIECPFSFLRRNRQVVEYQVVLPQLPGDSCTFNAILKDGNKKSIWKPDGELKSASLPPGFCFQGVYLNLVYEKGRSVRSSASDLHNFMPVFTGIWKNKLNLFFSGYVFLPADRCDIDSLKMRIIKFRDEDIQTCHQIEVEKVEEKVFGIYDPEVYQKYGGKVVYKIICKVDLDIVKSIYGYYNIFIEHHKVLVTPVNYYSKLAEKDYCYPLRLSPFKRALIVPYHDEFSNRWRLDIYHLSLLEWFKLKRLKKKCFTKAIKKDNTIWLIGEYTSTARDNGMQFYNYLCRKKGRIKAYYIIYRDSKDRSNLSKKNIIYYGSYKHFKIAAKAGVLVFSHMHEFLLPKNNLIVGYRGRMTKFKTVFIQHGIIATTAIALIYRKKQRKNDCFVVSSSFEKKIIYKYFGYNEEEIIVTGLARWDNLLAISKKSTDILIMPTYRNDLDNGSPTEFKKSTYYKFWSALLSNDDFLDLIRTNKINVFFYIHIGLARFEDCFDLPVEIKQVTTKNIQKLLSTCGLMVTDYSSVAFDVLIQDKPVIFCPFDYDEMMELRKGPKFISYTKDLPGPVCYELVSAVQEITKHVQNGYKIDPMYRERREKFYAHIDNNNCERLYEEVDKLVKL